MGRLIDADALLDIVKNKYSDIVAGRYPFNIVAYDMAKLVEDAPTVDRWIPCSERLPEEHDSIFAKVKNTNKWNNAMFEKISDDVNVTVEYEDGTCITKTSHTLDGKWKIEQELKLYNPKVIAWMPLPEAYKEGDIDNKKILTVAAQIQEEWIEEWRVWVVQHGGNVIDPRKRNGDIDGDKK